MKKLIAILSLLLISCKDSSVQENHSFTYDRIVSEINSKHEFVYDGEKITLIAPRDLTSKRIHTNEDGSIDFTLRQPSAGDDSITVIVEFSPASIVVSKKNGVFSDSVLVQTHELEWALSQ